MFGLLTHIKVKNLNLGDFVYKKGQNDSNIYMVYQGEVQIYTDKFREPGSSDIDDPFSLKKAGALGSTDFKSVRNFKEDHDPGRR